MIVSDEFLKQCEKEAFMKFDSCFSTGCPKKNA